MNVLSRPRLQAIFWAAAFCVNSIGYAGPVAPAEFAVKRGFYFAPLEVTVWTATAGAKLVVTTDGSEPTLNNGTVALGTNMMLRLTNTTVLRAAGFREGWLSSG